MAEKKAMKSHEVLTVINYFNDFTNNYNELYELLISITSVHNSVGKRSFNEIFNLINEEHTSFNFSEFFDYLINAQTIPDHKRFSLKVRKKLNGSRDLNDAGFITTDFMFKYRSEICNSLAMIRKNFSSKYPTANEKFIDCKNCKLAHCEVGTSNSSTLPEQVSCLLNPIYDTLVYSQNKKHPSYVKKIYVEKDVLIEFFENFRKMVEILSMNKEVQKIANDKQ